MHKYKYILGIDPGQMGAMFFYCKEAPGASFVEDFSGWHDAVDLLREKADCIKIAVIEKVHAMPGQGVTSSFNFGFGTGVYHGICRALKIPLVEVRPQEWQKGLGLPADRKKRKKALAEKAQLEFPEIRFFGAKGGVLDGRSDALYIAKYHANNGY